MRNEYLKKRKKELHLTNKKISELSGVPEGTVSKIMAGIVKNSKLNTLQAIAKVLECTIDDFDDVSNFDNSELFLSSLEKKVILSYRDKPEMQQAVKKLLDIE